MRGFLIKTGVALLIAGLFHLAAGFMADGTTDEYYLRFTTPRQKSLVLGGSHSAQGIHPEVFNNGPIAETFEGPLYNFSFTVGHSPYGPSYLRAIERKLDPSARNGLFIVQVDSWSITASKADPNDESLMMERQRFLGVMQAFNWRPNYEYLGRYYDRGWGSLGHWPIGDTDTSAVVMADGRLEMRIPLDSATVALRTQRRIAYYEDILSRNRTFSQRRLAFLGRIVELLDAHGTVLLLRLPTGQSVHEIEQKLDPQFDRHMQELVDKYGVRFIDWSLRHDEFTHSDGSHMDGPGGLKFSRELADEILRSRAAPLK